MKLSIGKYKMGRKYDFWDVSRDRKKKPITLSDRILELVALAMAVIMLVLTGVLYSKAPDIVPTHFNFAGEADGWEGKVFYWILAAIMLAGCGDNEQVQDMGPIIDPPGYSLFVWSNESDHRITMTVTDRFEKKEILPGESLLQEEVGFIIPLSLEEYTGNGATVVFDDGSYGGVFFRTDKVTMFNPCFECNLQIYDLLCD